MSKLYNKTILFHKETNEFINRDDTFLAIGQEKAIEKAKKLTTFGGKRFIGLTPKGVRMFVEYTINREDLSIDIKTTNNNNLGLLLKEGSKFPKERRTFKNGTKIKMNNRQLLSSSKKVDRYDVTENTLYWLKRLSLINELKFHKAFDKKGGASVNFFGLIAQAIFTGTYEYGEPIWRDIQNTWEFKEVGKYYNPEEVWKYPDEL